MRRFASYFSGFGLADVAALEAGYTPVLAVEFDPAIAAVHAANLGDDHLLVCSVTDVPEERLRSLRGVELFHASPPCTTASVANANGGETELDGALAEAVCRALRIMEPERFVLENVWGYTRYRAYATITACLDELGYGWTHEHLNAADWGVPQTRKRLVLRARRDGKRPLPMRPTHAQDPAAQTHSLFDAPLLPWAGWYEAVCDLLPSCPESKLARWQEERLRAKYGDGWLRALLVGAGGFNGDIADSEPHEPAFTLTANRNMQRQIRAALVDGKPANHEGEVRDVEEGAPAPTLTASITKHPYRAVLVSNGYPNRNGAIETAGDKPSPCVIASADSVPSRAVLASPSVRVVALTSRCLARFQTLPDWFKLPEKKSLACTGVGNGVAVRLFTAVFRSLC